MNYGLINSVTLVRECCNQFLGGVKLRFSRQHLFNKPVFVCGNFKNYCTKQNHVNVGTIGHVDHGKTTLTAALTKVSSEVGLSKFVPYKDIDRAVEEKTRGITINIAHVEYRTKKRHYAHFDCPGHADYIKNMISGTSQMDCAILVVAASEGSMPQTREHLLLAKQIGIRNIIVYINKCDEVEEDVIELVEMEISELLSDFGFESENCRFVAGSALKALEGVDDELGKKSILKLLDTLDTYIPQPQRDFDSPFVLSIDSCFSLPGRGSVAIGTLKQGIINRGDQCDLLGFDSYINTVANDIQVFHKSVPSAKAGDNVGVLLRGIKIAAIRRGMQLVKQGTQNLSNSFEATIYFLSKAEGGRFRPITSNYIQILFSSTWNLECRIDILGGGEMIMPGDHASVRLTLIKKMIMDEGQSFTIRENQTIVATGVITKKLESVNFQKLAKLKI